MTGRAKPLGAQLLGAQLLGAQLLGVQLLGAMGLLTRLPLPAHVPAAPVRCLWAYPVAGLVVGLIGAAMLHGPFPAAVAATFAVIASAIATGGLHEDGLADTCDALGGGRDPERRLAILRDSRIGAHGALALMLATALRIAALASMSRPHATLAFIAASTLSRGLILPVLLMTGPARPDGLGASLGDVRPRQVMAGLGLALVLFFLLAPPGGRGLAVVGGVVASLVVGRIAASRFGGFTGDLLGAAALTGECVVLACLAG